MGFFTSYHCCQKDRMEDMAMKDILPPDVTQGAMLRGNEYGWGVSSHPPKKSGEAG